MKNLLIALTMLAPIVATAQDGETILRSSTETVSYATVKPNGGLQTEQAWQGYKIVKRADGNCYRIEHTDLRIEADANGQRAQFKESTTAIRCPI